jgi:hypothetical protein
MRFGRDHGWCAPKPTTTGEQPQELPHRGSLESDRLLIDLRTMAREVEAIASENGVTADRE